MSQIKLNRDALYTRGGILDALMDGAFDVAVLVDEHCRVIYISESSFRMISQRKQVIGQDVSQMDNVSPFRQVISTGQSATGLLLEINGRKCVSNIFPIVDQGKVIGALGTILFRSLTTIKKIFARIQQEVEGLDLGEIYQNLAQMDSGYTFSDYLGDSPPVQELLSKCKKVAACDVPVLLIGETGTGKEIIASAIHAARHSDHFAPYVTINCTAIPENLLESELFGYEKGAFTGAEQNKTGKFEQAGSGDILLDEIGDMSLHLQSKLLRVLESREFERLGGRRVIPFRAGVIAATNKNLPRLSQEGVFRPDLYYRLSIIELFLPPLRQRVEDIPMLIEHFSHERQGKLRFTRQAMDYLGRYAWPGNVRQLRNVVNRLLIFYDGMQITGEQIIAELSAGKNSYNEVLDPNHAGQHEKSDFDTRVRSLEATEREAITRTLDFCGRNITETARILGIGRATLYKKMEKYKISNSTGT